MKRIIAIGLGPNEEKDDVTLAQRLLCTPWKYMSGDSPAKVEAWFMHYFHVAHAVSFNSGRTALYAILRSLQIGEGDEVLLQAFTCVVVPNAIRAVGASPVYVDITDSLTMHPKDVEKKITKKTKVIVVQHTFGIPTDMDAIMRIAEKHHLSVIEDVAHTIGGEYKGKKLGTFGIAAMFSLGRDKAFSSTFGGVAITSDKELGKRLKEYNNSLQDPSRLWTAQQLVYPIIVDVIVRSYNVFSFGKVLHYLLRRIHFFSFPVTAKERRGEYLRDDAKKYPEALARLTLLQLTKLEKYNKKRKEFVIMYNSVLKSISKNDVENNPLLRYPFLVKNKREAIRYLAERKMYIGDWYNQVIDPKNVVQGLVGYVQGSCPIAEKTVQHIINLPTYPALEKEDAERVMMVLKEYTENNKG